MPLFSISLQTRNHAPDPIPLRLTQHHPQILLQRLYPIRLTLNLMQLLALPIPPLLNLIPKQRDIPHHLPTLLIQQKLQTHHAVREPAARAPAHEEIHRLEIIGEKLHLAETIPGNPRRVVRIPQVVHPEFLLGVRAVRAIGDMLLLQQQAVRGFDVERLVACFQGDGEGWAVTAEPDVDEILFAGDRDDRHHVVPAIVARPCPGLRLAHGLDRAVDPGTRRHDAETETPHHGREQQRVLHAVAASPVPALNAFVEEVQGVEADGVVG